MLANRRAVVVAEGRSATRGAVRVAARNMVRDLETRRLMTKAEKEKKKQEKGEEVRVMWCWWTGEVFGRRELIGNPDRSRPKIPAAPDAHDDQFSACKAAVRRQGRC